MKLNSELLINKEIRKRKKEKKKEKQQIKRNKMRQLN